MLRVFTPLALIIGIVAFTLLYDPVLDPIDNYPIWLKDESGKQTNQTSGLQYLGERGSKKIFLSCDDIGNIHRLVIDEKSEYPSVSIEDIYFSNEVNEFFKDYEKKDFEEIFLDRERKTILLAVEGSVYKAGATKTFKDVEGIFELTYNKDYLTFDSVLTISKPEMPELLFDHTMNNISFEGLGVTGNTLFLGLENLQVEEGVFSNSTILYVLQRGTRNFREISTAGKDIATICGLYADGNYDLYGIDRNMKKLFYIKFNPDYSIDKIETRDISLPIPGHDNIDNIIGISPEAITLDDEKNIYIAIDPWKDFYRPTPPDTKFLTAEELENFKSFTPLLYKYDNPFK